MISVFVLRITLLSLLFCNIFTMMGWNFEHDTKLVFQTQLMLNNILRLPCIAETKLRNQYMEIHRMYREIASMYVII